MRRTFSVLLSALLFAPGFFGFAPETSPKPKLVVAIIVDQFRYDYLTRFRSDYQGGLDQLLTKGADFTNAFYAQVPTVTAVGHSIFLSGAMPAVSGIIGNTWYDRDEEQVVTSVCDWEQKQVGSDREVTKKPVCTDADPASPRRLLVSTIGDELRTAHPESKVVGISIKARGAILPSGHRAAGAYWFDDDSGHFISSTFYMNKLPPWAEKFNSRKLSDQYLNKSWEGFPKWNMQPAAGVGTYGGLPYTPWGNELIEGFSEEALVGEKLGQGSATDLLTISFSSNDYVGHRAGPDSPEVHDMSKRTDALLAKLFKRIDDTVGLQNTIIVFSADHGVASTPEQSEADRMPGGYLVADIEEAVGSALTKRFGKARWIVPGGSDTAIYLNREALDKAKGTDGRPLLRSEAEEVARETVLAIPQFHVARVYTREQLENGVTGDFIAEAEMNGFYPRRSGDLFLVFEPNYMSGTSGTTHFSPYGYDRHVPVLMMGPGIRPGRYHGTIVPNDIAPTLAVLLNIQTPNGSSGRVLTEALAQ